MNREPNWIACALALALVVSSAGQAQVGLTAKQQENYSFNAESCGLNAEEVAFQYELNLMGTMEQLSWAIHLYESGTDCPALMMQEPLFVMYDFGRFENFSDSNRFIPVLDADRSVLPRDLLGDELCQGVRAEYQICLYLSTRQKLDDSVVIIDGDITFDERTLVAVDTSVPGKPNLGNTGGLNTAVTLTIDNLDDIARIVADDATKTAGWIACNAH